jgi:osmotically-inducible protein OsmY
MDRFMSLFGRGAQQAQQQASYYSGQATGVMRETVPHTPDNPNPDDNTLKDRVESEIARGPEISRANLNINVADGIVELRGEFKTQQEIDQIVERVRQIPNVKGIHNYLHLPGTPAPNKASVLEVS